MSLHREALAELATWSPPAGRQTELRDRYVAHLHAHPDGTERSCFPDHLTSGTLVLSADGEQRAAQPAPQGRDVVPLRRALRAR